MTEQRDFDAERRRILRRLGMLTWAAGGAAVLLAAAGGALIAWLFQTAGHPFLRTWIIVSVLLLALPAALHLATRRK